MIKTVLTAAAIVLAILGLCEVMHAVRMLLLAPKRLPGAVTVVNLGGEEPLRQLHYAGTALSWNGTAAGGVKLAVCGLPPGKRREECRRAAERYDITLCSAEQLPRILDEILKK